MSDATLIFSHLSESQRSELTELHQKWEQAGSLYSSPEYFAMDQFVTEKGCIARPLGSCCNWRETSISEWVKYAVNKEFNVD